VRKLSYSLLLLIGFGFALETFFRVDACGGAFHEVRDVVLTLGADFLKAGGAFSRVIFLGRSWVLLLI
jgi:hypothetical protein